MPRRVCADAHDDVCEHVRAGVSACCLCTVLAVAEVTLENVIKIRIWAIHQGSDFHSVEKFIFHP